MKLNESPFERIKDGTKTIEFRLYDEKRRQIKIGDQIEFSKLPELQETILVDVLELYIEPTFEKLFKKLYTDEEDIKRKTTAMYQYYSPENEKEYGVVGIKISLHSTGFRYTYNKLVRDKIPEIIKADGKECKTRILSKDEYIAALETKLNEEVAEYQEDKNLEEMADVLEVLQAICLARGYSLDELEAMRIKKAKERGGFKDKIFLEYVAEKR